MSAPDAERTLVGQHLLIGFPGTTISDAVASLRRFRPAGLILLPRNIRSAEQVAELIAGAQVEAATLGLPSLIVAVDQEGGAITRLSSSAGFTDMPSAMVVGRAGHLADARRLAGIIGREVAAVGVNLDFAPVLDLAIDPGNSVIGSRSFGADPVSVASMGAAVIDGIQAEGVLACAKHFPGHGATDVDSHLDLPRLRSTQEELERRDLVPFQRGIASGCAAIMTAHVLSALDPEMPVTLSKAVLTGQLRGRMGFDGLILTDALEMKALAKTGVARDRLGLTALQAGADLLVFEGDSELIEATARSLEGALVRGELEETAIVASAPRMAAARARVARRAGGRGALSALSALGSDAHTSETWSVARAGIRVSDPGGLLPLGPSLALLPTSGGYAFAAAMGWPLPTGEGPSAVPGPAVVVVADDDLSDSDRSDILALEASGVPVVLVVLGGWQPPAGIRPAVTVFGEDLPRSMWPIIAERLGQPAPTSREAGFQGLLRRG